MGFFDLVAPFYNRVLHRAQSHQLRYVAQFLAPRPGERVLDVGAGTGVLLAQLYRQGAQVTGLDRSGAMLREAEKACPGCDLVLGDAMAMPFPEETFDAVVCVDALHHFPDRERALQEMIRVLKEGGRLLILDLERHHWFTRLIQAAEWLVAERSHFYTAQELVAWLGQAGVKAEVEYISPVEYLVKGHKGRTLPVKGGTPPGVT